MHINLSKEDLLHGVNTVAKAVSSKNSLPILSGIMISAKDGQITFRATDLEMAIEYTISGDIIEEGDIVVPGRYFSDLVKSLPAGLIKLECPDGMNLSIFYGQSNITVCCFDAAEFPSLPKADSAVRKQLPAPLFRKLIRQTAIATASDEIRPVFTGILLELEDNRIKMVATDTHRMAISEGTCLGEGNARLIVPGRTMTEIARLAVNDDEPVVIIADKAQVYFYTGNITFISRVISGQFPDYKSVVPAPSAFNYQATVNKAGFLESIERASLISKDQSKVKGNTVKLQWRENIAFISADVPDVGKIMEEVPIDFEGNELDCYYNGRYISECLRVLDEEKFVFRMTGAVTPAIIVPEQDNSYLYLVLPIRTAN